MKLLLLVALVALVSADTQMVLQPSSSSCGCVSLPVCACRPQFQAPEIKPEAPACGCINQPSCACAPSAPSAVSTEKTYSVTQDSCGCMHLTECACRQFVQPEYKADAPTVTQDSCGCLHLETCGCRAASAPAPTMVVTQDACGCLHLTSCGCRPSYQAPEIKDTLKETIAPEIKKPDANCACEGKPTCGCSTIQIVPANSLNIDSSSSSSCGCISEPVCGCRASLKNNDVVGESVLKPYTVSA